MFLLSADSFSSQSLSIRYTLDLGFRVVGIAVDISRSICWFGIQFGGEGHSVILEHCSIEEVDAFF